MPRGSGGIGVNGAKVPVAVDEGHDCREGPGEACEGVAHDGVPVRMATKKGQSAR